MCPPEYGQIISVCILSFIYLFIFKFDFFIDSLLVSCPTPQICSASRHPISSTHPCSTAPKKKTKQSKQDNNQTKTRMKQQQKLLGFSFSISPIPFHSSRYHWGPQCHTIYPFIYQLS